MRKPMWRGTLRGQLPPGASMPILPQILIHLPNPKQLNPCLLRCSISIKSITQACFRNETPFVAKIRHVAKTRARFEIVHWWRNALPLETGRRSKRRWRTWTRNLAMRRHPARSCLTLAVLLIGTTLLSGCAYLQAPKIDPSGQQFFLTPPISTSPVYRPETGPFGWGEDAGVTLAPRATVAPVGSEVVLLGGVVGDDNYLRTNRRLEWSISPEGVGHFVTVGPDTWTDWMFCDFNNPRKVDNSFAIGSTSRDYTLLDRGTETPSDDVRVLRGQDWVTVTSPVEGTSQITVFSPSVSTWGQRKRTARIHWIDGQWRYPPPAISAAGASHTFTTTVTRHTDQQPRAGWTVRYEIVDGPAAGFSPDGASFVEVTTDSAGRASAEIIQTEPGSGTNRVSVQIIRPASPENPLGKRYSVGNGTTSITWTSPDLALSVSAPSEVDLGGELRYRIDVSNPGDLPAEDVVVTDLLPPTLTYIQSTPPAEGLSDTLRWQLGTLQARETKTIEIDCRTTTLGTVENCAEAIGQGGAGPGGQMTARHCATTTVLLPSINLQITGPPQVMVNGDVTFTIVLTNLSRVPIEDLLIKDTFDQGLMQPEIPPNELESNTIERELGRLDPGETQRIEVMFRAVEAGQLCHTVTVSNSLGIQATAQGCVTAIPVVVSDSVRDSLGQTSPTPSQPHDPPVGPTFGEPITVKIIGPTGGRESRTVGEMAEYQIAVINSGNVPLTNLRVVDRFDPTLSPEEAAAGYRWIGHDGLEWTIDRLEPGTTAPLLGVTFECRAAAREACHTVTVMTEDGKQFNATKCLEILPAQEGLVLSVTDLTDFVAQGKDYTYEILVTNRGTTVDRDITIVATLPLGVVPYRLQTRGPTPWQIEGQQIHFDPVAELQPGDELVYRVGAVAEQDGEHVFEAEMTSRNHPNPTVKKTTTEVFP